MHTMTLGYTRHDDGTHLYCETCPNYDHNLGFGATIDDAQQAQTAHMDNTATKPPKTPQWTEPETNRPFNFEGDNHATDSNPFTYATNGKLYDRNSNEWLNTTKHQYKWHYHHTPQMTETQRLHKLNTLQKTLHTHNKDYQDMLNDPPQNTTEMQDMTNKSNHIRNTMTTLENLTQPNTPTLPNYTD